MDMPIAIYAESPYDILIKEIEYGIDDYAIIQVGDKICRRKIHYTTDDAYIIVSQIKRYFSNFIKIIAR